MLHLVECPRSKGGPTAPVFPLGPLNRQLVSGLSSTRLSPLGCSYLGSRGACVGTCRDLSQVVVNHGRGSLPIDLSDIRSRFCRLKAISIRADEITIPFRAFLKTLAHGSQGLHAELTRLVPERPRRSRNRSARIATLGAPPPGAIGASHRPARV
jgi:hypothetical protein